MGDTWTLCSMNMSGNIHYQTPFCYNNLLKFVVIMASLPLQKFREFIEKNPNTPYNCFIEDTNMLVRCNIC